MLQFDKYTALFTFEKATQLYAKIRLSIGPPL